MLDELAIKYGTDKSSKHHNYCKVYESYLKEYKNSKVALIELGVGGYQYPDRGGEGLRMWYEYFPNAKLIGIDIYPKSGIINDRTEFWQGSQVDKELLQSIIERKEEAEIRIIIDDASHVNPLTIKTFEIAFPLLKSGDLYFIEDVHTSYWPGEYKGSYNLFDVEVTTVMNYFQHLTNYLNYEHIQNGLIANEFKNTIEFIHFYKEMIVIKRL